MLTGLISRYDRDIVGSSNLPPATIKRNAMSEVRIKEAAILGNDGKVYTGRNHGIIIQTYGKDGIFKYRKTSTQGFVTNTGEFVDRFEALKIAVEADQIEVKYSPKDRLLSEDLKEITSGKSK